MDVSLQQLTQGLFGLTNARIRPIHQDGYYGLQVKLTAGICGLLRDHGPV